MSNKNRFVFVFLVVILLVGFFIFSQLINPLQNKPENTKVSPKRTIVVDNNLKILQIISNTKKEVEPTVRLENGMEISLTYFISEQYAKIKPTVNFSKTGTVYDSRRIYLFGIALSDSFNIIYKIFKDLLSVSATNK